MNVVGQSSKGCKVDGDGDKVSIKLYYHGMISYSPRPHYEGGKEYVVRDMDIERMTLNELKALGRSVGVRPDSRFYHLDEENRFINVADDEDLWIICHDACSVGGMVEIYEKPQKNRNDKSECSGNFDRDVDPSTASGMESCRPSDHRAESSGNEHGNTGEEDQQMTIIASKIGVANGSLSDSDMEVYPISDNEIVYPEAPIYNPREHSLDPPLCVGLIFSTFSEFKDAVRSWNIKRGRGFYFVKNDKKRCRAVCESANCTPDPCKWKIYAARIGAGRGHIEIRTFREEHTCKQMFKNPSVNSSWVARKFHGHLKENPELSSRKFKKKVVLDNHFFLSKHQAKKSRGKALKIVRGSEIDQYSQIRDYGDEILRSNPGSTVVIKIVDDICDLRTGQSRFERMYVCFGGLKAGFLSGCRPWIGLDGTFLRINCGGMLLTAVGTDPNDGYFPFAFAAVEGENGDSWGWFLSLLRDDLGIGDDSTWTIMSDKQKGIIQATMSVFPHAEHRFCVRHLHANFSAAGFRGNEFKAALFKAAKAPTPVQFRQAMIEIADMDVDAVKWLEDKDPCEWSRAHFRLYSTSESITNNVCESFNAKIGEARSEPIVGMFESIKLYLIERMDELRTLARRRWSRLKICPNIVKKVEERSELSKACLPHKCNEGLYEVECTASGETFAVNLMERSCGCRSWQLSGLPCCHAISAIWDSDGEPIDYVHECYSVEKFLQCYENNIMPMNGSHDWVPSGELALLPPLYARPAGRPRKKRKLSQVEILEKKCRTKKARRTGLIPSCTLCRDTGHYRTTCPSRIVPAEMNGTSLGDTQDEPILSAAGTSSATHMVESSSKLDPVPPKKMKKQVRRKNEKYTRLKDVQADESDIEPFTSSAPPTVSPMWAAFKMKPPKFPIGSSKKLVNLKPEEVFVDVLDKSLNPLNTNGGLIYGKKSKHRKSIGTKRVVPMTQKKVLVEVEAIANSDSIANVAQCKEVCDDVVNKVFKYNNPITGAKSENKQIFHSHDWHGKDKENTCKLKGPHTARLSASGIQGGVFVQGLNRKLLGVGSFLKSNSIPPMQSWGKEGADFQRGSMTRVTLQKDGGTSSGNVTQHITSLSEDGLKEEINCMSVLGEAVGSMPSTHVVNEMVLGEKIGVPFEPVIVDDCEGVLGRRQEPMAHTSSSNVPSNETKPDIVNLPNPFGLPDIGQYNLQLYKDFNIPLPGFLRGQRHP